MKATITKYCIAAIIFLSALADNMEVLAQCDEPGDFPVGSVGGGGDVCVIPDNGTSFVQVWVSNSAYGDGIFYTLIRDGVDVAELYTRDGGLWTDGEFPGPGRYTVRANKGSCSLMMTGHADVTFAAGISQYDVTGGGLYCIIGQPFSVRLSGSQVGVEYSLRIGQSEISDSKAGTGGELVWSNLTREGSYTVFGSKDGCSKKMNGTVAISASSDNIPFGTVQGGGNVCVIPDNGTSFVSIWVSNSEYGDNIFYTLIRDGVIVVELPPRDGGTWAEREFPGPGQYTVQATKGSCSVVMSGHADVTFAGDISQYHFASSGVYRAGEESFSVKLNGSQVGVIYALRIGQSDISDLKQGTGSELDWNNLTIQGDYTVIGRMGECSKRMIGTVTIAFQNLISTAVLTRELQDFSEAEVEDMAISNTYLDGLGRPMQSVSIQSSPSKKDIVAPIFYDQFGRESQKYLPYISSENSGWYKPAAITEQVAFYTTPPPNIVTDPMPYSVTAFEPSPLNRVLKQGAPGAAWQPNSDLYSMVDHTVKKLHELNNAEEVYLFRYDMVSGLVSLPATVAEKYYQPSELYANKTIDEQNNEVIEYVDKEGRTVCKKVKTSATEYASTYYIYDDLGNLSVVLPPEAVKAITAP